MKKLICPLIIIFFVFAFGCNKDEKSEAFQNQDTFLDIEKVQGISVEELLGFFNVKDLSDLHTKKVKSIHESEKAEILIVVEKVYSNIEEAQKAAYFDITGENFF